MRIVGVRDLRQRASEILRRVAEGETFEITHRGRPVALLVKAAPRGIAQLEREGMLRPAEGDLLDLAPLPLPRGARKPSVVVSEQRAD